MIIFSRGKMKLVELLFDYRARRRAFWNYFVIIVPGDRACGTTLRLSCYKTGLVELLYDYRARRRGFWNYFVIIVPGDRPCATHLESTWHKEEDAECRGG